jgi:hypothetical protein
MRDESQKNVGKASNIRDSAYIAKEAKVLGEPQGHRVHEYMKIHVPLKGYDFF